MGTIRHLDPQASHININPKGMKGSIRGYVILLVAIECLSSTAVPVNHARSLRNQLYGTASKRMSPLVAAAAAMEEPQDSLPDAATLNVEEILTQLSTEELVRMLELLDMLETKSPIQASERELAILQYLLNNYPN